MKTITGEPKREKQHWSRPAATIALSYVIVASCWIFATDIVVEWMAASPNVLSTLQTYKGIGFVLTTGGLLYVLLAREFRRREATEEQLYTSREQLRLAVQTANVGLWDWKLNTKEVSYSPQWKAQIGYAEDEISNDFDEWASRVHPDDLATITPALKDFLSNPSSKYEQEFRLRHKDGTYRWILAQGSVLYDAQGMPNRMVGSHIDITERKQMETQHLELALEKQRVETLKELIGNLSHDLKNPLATIEFSLAMVEQDSVTAHQQNELDTIRRQADRLNQQIQNIITLSRLDYMPEVDRRPVDVNDLLKKVEQTLMPSLSHKQVNLRLELEKRPLSILGDEAELERALVNLVDNAVHYTPSGGSIVIKTDQRAGNCVLEVADTGVGITDEDLPKIFDRFYRSPNSRLTDKTGSGLGLAIVKRVVEMHAGRIEVESREGEGSVFRVTLPAETNAGV